MFELIKISICKQQHVSDELNAVSLECQYLGHFEICLAATHVHTYACI